MTFGQFINIIKNIFSSIFTWLISISSALLNNFVFKIILFLAILGFLISLILKLYNKSQNISEEEEEQLIYTSNNEYQADYWDEEDFLEEDDDDYD